MMMPWRATYSCRVAIMEGIRLRITQRGKGGPTGKAHVRHVSTERKRGPILPSPDLNYRIRGPPLPKFKRAERTAPVGQAQ